MGWDIAIGRPIHFAGRHYGWGACGVNASDETRNPDLVTCLRCRKTRAFKQKKQEANGG